MDTKINMNKKRKISYVNILSNSNKDLITFYRDVVGLQSESNNGEKWHGFETEGATLGIEPMSNREKYDFDYAKGNPVLIQFQADSLEDLTAWTEDLENKGVKIDQRILSKSYGVVSTFTDPDGNVIELLYEN